MNRLFVLSKAMTGSNMNDELSVALLYWNHILRAFE